MASGRMRFAMGLTVVGTVLLIAGLLMLVVGEALRLKSGHGGPGIVRTGAIVAFCGLGIGVALLVTLAVGRAEGAPADRARGRSPGRRDAPDEWLGPPRMAGAGIVAQRVPPSWPGPAESRPGAGDYADDGWHPDMDEEWRPGPAYVWSPGEEDGWNSYADGDWDPGADDGWSPGEPAGIAAWPPAHLAGPEPGLVAGYGSDRDAEYALGPAAGYLTAGPGPGPAVASPFPAKPESDYPGAESSDIPEADGTRQDDDTSPIPVVRDAGEPAAPPRASEPGPALEAFSVWEPAPKPEPAREPEPFSVWEPAPKPEPGPAPEPFSVWEPAQTPSQPEGRDGRADEAYQPAHAEPPAAHTQEKIEQIKDLYLTAEAIGEDALGRHFDELRQRQRSLISEFFQKAGLGAKDTPPLLGDDTAQDGASLPG